MAITDVIKRFGPVPPKHDKERHNRLRDVRELELLSAARNPSRHQELVGRVGVQTSSRLLSSQPDKTAYKHLRGLMPTATPSLESLRQVAEVESFGARIITAAQESLPVEAKMSAQRMHWINDPDARAAEVSVAFNLLFPSQWTRSHQVQALLNREERGASEDAEHYDVKRDPWSALPHLFGRYPETTTFPTCLGVAILCAAWCELAEVPYMLAWLVDSDSSYHWRRFVQQRRRIVGFCEARGIGLPGALLTFMRADFDTYEEMTPDTAAGATTDPHAMVVMELNSDEWLVCDPWQEKVYFLDKSGYQARHSYDVVSPGRAHQLLTELGDTQPGLTLSHRTWCWDDAWSDFDAEVNDVLEYTELLLEAQASYAPDEDTLRAYARWLGQAMARYPVLLDFNDATIDAQTNLSRGVRRDLSLERTTAASLQSRWISQYYQVSGSRQRDTGLFWDMCDERYEAHPQFREQVQQDLIVQPLCEVAGSTGRYLDTLLGDRQRFQWPHPVLEFGRPAMQVGLGVLMHLYATDRWTRQQFALSELSDLTSSQVVAHEVVTDAHFRVQQVTSEADQASWSFGSWLASGGQDNPDLVELPGYSQLDLDWSSIRQSWAHLTAMPSPFRSPLVNRLLQRLQVEAIHHSTSTHEGMAHGHWQEEERSRDRTADHAVA